MPVPSSISQISQTASSNSPAGSESPNTADDYFRTYASYIAMHRDGAGFSQEATVASAATTDIGAAASMFVQISGTTTITSFGLNYNGPRFVRFAGALTLTHNASTLILPGAANIITAAGDTAMVVPVGNPATGWQVADYTRADGSVLVAGSVGTAALAANSVTPAKLANSGNELGWRNRIINGDMRIDQRNAGASTTASDYILDRWAFIAGGGTLTKQQSTQAPPGFSNSLSVTVTSAGTRNAADYFHIYQSIEGFNASDLALGTASAQTVTLSFWVRSSLTGTYSGVLASGSNNRSYGFTYAINAANTWEYKTVVVVGDTTGGTTDYPTDNTAGLRVKFDLGSGSNYQTTAGAWAAAVNRGGVSGTVSFAQTAGATFFITGVQLEGGSTATPFERVEYGEQLRRCQRYFQRLVEPNLTGYAPGGSTSVWRMGCVLPVQMRAGGTLSLVGTPPLTSSGATSLSSISTNYSNNGNSIEFDGVANASITGSGSVVKGICSSSTTAYTISAEL